MASLLKRRITPKIGNCLLIALLLQISLSKCESGSDDENNREKRTIGVLFRSFVDAFQPQKQQPPTVYSYRPQKQSSPPQSTKADLLGSSKNLFQQKKNLFKSSSAQTPDTEVIRPTVTPASTTTPSAEPIPQVAPYNQAQVQPPPSPLPTAPLNPFPNLIPPSGHHPLNPLKAQILIIPFQGQHGTTTTFPGFGTDSSGGISPFNYQAEIYLHSPRGGVYPPINQYPTQYQYSPANGWHDVDEILTSGVQMSGKDSKDAGVVDLTKHNDRGNTGYNANAGFVDQTPSVPANSAPERNSDGNQQTGVEGHRRGSQNQNYLHEPRNYLPQPLLIPNFHQNPLFDAANFGTFHGEGIPLFAPFAFQNHNPANELPKLQNNYQQYGYNSNLEEQRQSNNGASAAATGGSQNIQPGHDFVPQRQPNLKDNGKVQQYEQEGINQNQIYYQQQDPYQPYQLEQLPQENYQVQYQYPTKIGRLPDPYEYQNHAQTTTQHQQQQSPVYNNEYFSAHTGASNYKRSNSIERSSYTKN